MTTINIISTVIRVTDPCYDRDTGLDCIGIVGNVLPGLWDCIVNREQDGVISSIGIRHQNYSYDSTGPSGTAEVDSGQCGFIDESFMPHHVGDYDDGESFYRKVCDQTLDEGEAYGENWFFTSTAYGDGSYRWETEMNSSNEVVSIKLFYIDEEEDEEEDWASDEEEDDFLEMEEEIRSDLEEDK